ncbi:MAG: hypothetical protein QG650_1122 [Patescibacteria group bacterium]|nr:hypothetical protein [Patescibacteria group bacterium]
MRNSPNPLRNENAFPDTGGRFGKRSAFTLAEIIFAVAIISVSLLGASALISTGGRQASQAEDDRESSDLLLSVRTCVSSFGIPYLRSVPSGTKVSAWFGSGGTECLTGTAYTGTYDWESAPKITLKNFSGSGTSADAESGNREYGAYFTTSVVGIGTNSVKPTVTITNGTFEKTLGFRLDGK